MQSHRRCCRGGRRRRRRRDAGQALCHPGAAVGRRRGGRLARHPVKGAGRGRWRARWEPERCRGGCGGRRAVIRRRPQRPAERPSAAGGALPVSRQACRASACNGGCGAVPLADGCCWAGEGRLDCSDGPPRPFRLALRGGRGSSHCQCRPHCKQHERRRRERCGGPRRRCGAPGRGQRARWRCCVSWGTRACVCGASGLHDDAFLCGTARHAQEVSASGNAGGVRRPRHLDRVRARSRAALRAESRAAGTGQPAVVRERRSTPGRCVLARPRLLLHATRRELLWQAFCWRARRSGCPANVAVDASLGCPGWC
jgi:hypothetical protein